MKPPALRLAATLAALTLAGTASAAVKPGLEGAQDLFRRNHWEEARAHLRGAWDSLPAKDRPAATFLIGRSHVREAELYRALRQIGVEVGLVYLKELAAERVNRRVALVPLFTAFYQLESGDERAAARGLLAASRLRTLPPEWKAVARLRHAVALRRTGSGRRVAAVLAQPGIEARFWRLLDTGVADASPMKPTTDRERLFAATILFRGGRAWAAEPLLAGLDLDLPEAEDHSDPQKVLRFYDPLVAAAWERVCWERAVMALRPQAIGGSGLERTLAAYYTGLSLFELGEREESLRFLRQASGASLPAPLQASAQVLLAAGSWHERAPAPAALLRLWEATQAQPDAVLVWDELSHLPQARGEPFTRKLGGRLRGLLRAPSGRPSGALVGRWALARLRRGADPASLVTTLAEYRDDSNKNKLDWNDPLLLVALVAANSRNQQYAQSLETLFELAKTLPGLRWLQWNLQGVYAARQKAGGEARISQ